MGLPLMNIIEHSLITEQEVRYKIFSKLQASTVLHYATLLALALELVLGSR